MQGTAACDVGTVRVLSPGGWSARDGPLVLLGQWKLASLGIAPCELYCGMCKCPRFFRVFRVRARSRGLHVWVPKKRAHSLCTEPD